MITYFRLGKILNRKHEAVSEPLPSAGGAYSIRIDTDGTKSDISLITPYNIIIENEWNNGYIDFIVEPNTSNTMQYAQLYISFNNAAIDPVLWRVYQYSETDDPTPEPEEERDYTGKKNYKGRFFSQDYRYYEVRFIGNPTSDEFEEIDFGSDPFVLTYETSETLFEPIRKSTASIDVITQDYLFSLFSPYADGTEVFLYELTEDDGSAVTVPMLYYNMDNTYTITEGDRTYLSGSEVTLKWSMIYPYTMQSFVLLILNNGVWEEFMTGTDTQVSFIMPKCDGLRLEIVTNSIENIKRIEYNADNCMISPLIDGLIVGNDYRFTFTPFEGYTMSEIILYVWTMGMRNEMHRFTNTDTINFTVPSVGDYIELQASAILSHEEPEQKNYLKVFYPSRANFSISPMETQYELGLNNLEWVFRPMSGYSIKTSWVHKEFDADDNLVWIESGGMTNYEYQPYSKYFSSVLQGGGVRQELYFTVDVMRLADDWEIWCDSYAIDLIDTIASAISTAYGIYDTEEVKRRLRHNDEEPIVAGLDESQTDVTWLNQSFPDTHFYAIQNNKNRI